MSQIRRSEPIEAIEAPPREPLISLSDILSGMGWFAFQGTKLAVKATVAGSVLAFKGARAIAKAVQEARPLTLTQVGTTIRQSATAGDALRALAATPGFELPQAVAENWGAKAQQLVAKNDKAGVEKLVHEIVRARQDRLQASLMHLAAEVCGEIGFSVAPFHADHGVLIAKSRDGRQTITVAVDKTKEGETKLRRDADGFHGGACIQMLDRFDTGLRSRGVRFRDSTPICKHRAPVFDGRRIPQVIHARSIR